MKGKILKFPLILKTTKIIIILKTKKIKIIKKIKIMNNMIIFKSKFTLENNYQKNNYKEIK